MAKAPILPQVPSAPLDKSSDELYRVTKDILTFLEKLIRVLFTFMNKQQSRLTNAITVSGQITYFDSDNISGNSVQDKEYKINLPFDAEFTYAAIFGSIAATGSSPSVQFRNASGGGGSGITVTLDAGTKKYGTGTGSFTITTGNSLYLRFTDCHQFGGFNIGLSQA